MNPFNEMKEHHVWAYIVTVLATGLVLIVSIASYYGERDDERIKALIEQGQHPLELACLFRYDEDLKMQCYALYHARAAAVEKGKVE